MAVRISLDPDLCIGSTECNREAAAAFALDEARGVSVVLEGAARTDEQRLLRAAEACPTMAIRLRRADGSLLFGED